MTLDEVAAYIEKLNGVLVLRPQPGDGTPEISWGDLFFYFAPSGELPATQPFATIVTKDYPDDQSSRLDRTGAFRVNVAVGNTRFTELIGRGPRDESVGESDASEFDKVIAHPVYGGLGWVSVVNPGPRTEMTLQGLLIEAHRLAANRAERRTEAEAGE